MKIVDFCAADTGGQSYKLTSAINKYSCHTARSLVKDLNYIDLPYDILFGNHDPEFIKEYLSKVDIVHCHNKYRYANGWAPVNPKAKWVLHQHGRFPTIQDMQTIYDTDKQRKALRVVSTINLLKYVNNDFSRWIPAPLDVSEMGLIKKINYVPHEKIKLAHSPTNRKIKDTELLIKICSEIPEIELVLIEGLPYSESLRLRSLCDITFDQLIIGYGNSALEAMCFGQPVISGMNDFVKRIIKDHIGVEPYVSATEQTLKSVLLKFVHEPEYRNLYGKLGNEYVKKWHDNQNVMNRVLNIYNKL